MTYQRRLARIGVVVGVALLAAACTRSEQESPPARAHVEVTMREFTFEHDDVPGGQVVFDIRNTGDRWHRLSLIPLPPDLPPIQEQLQGDDRAVVNTLAGIPDTPPGGTGTFATELVPGRYALICFLVESDGTSHVQEGMATEFVVS